MFHTGVPYRSQWYYDWSCGTGLSQNWHNGKKGLLTAWKQRVSFHDLLWWWRHTLLSVYGTIGSWIRQLRLCILRMSDHHIRSLRSYLFQDQCHIHEIRKDQMQHLVLPVSDRVKNDHNTVWSWLLLIQDPKKDLKSTSVAFAKAVLRTSRYRPDTRQHPGLWWSQSSGHFSYSEAS